MILFSTRMSSSGRSRSRCAWVYAENMLLQVLGVPLVPPRCGIWARRHHAEMVFMNELWFAVVPPPSAPTIFLMLQPKALTNLSVAEALDLGGRSAKDLRQVRSTPKRVCAAAWVASGQVGNLGE